MVRRLDREIQDWSRRPVRDQLALLWDEVECDEVRITSCWEEEPWSSSYVISGSQPRRPLPGKWWAVCFLNFDGHEDSQVVLSDDREVEVPAASLADAKEIRRLLEVPGIETRPELAQMLITLGCRRDELDIPTLLGFAGHSDRVLRYMVLGALSWQPSISNGDLAVRFGKDPDVRVRDLARRLASGRIRRKTRERMVSAP